MSEPTEAGYKIYTPAEGGKGIRFNRLLVVFVLMKTVPLLTRP